MRRVVVIGADGFLGRNLSRRLVDSGYEVLALVFDQTRTESLHKIEHLEIKPFNFESIDSLYVKDYDTIFHMAWTGVSSNVKNEAYIQVSNVSYGLKVLDFARRNNINKVVVPGSAAEVSCGDGIITGYEVPAPADMYSACKVATRFVCQSYAKQLGIELIWTLITSIYGPGRNDNNLITYAIKSLIAGEKPSFTGLEQKWDYLYIDDLIYALILLGEKGKGGKVYPVGGGEYDQMKSYVNIIRDIINPNMPLGIGDIPYKNPDKIDNQMLDISALKDDTGFTPRYTFSEGIKLTIDFFKSKS